jgi:DNA-binding SARP family transcriptional activator/tetratricopeptide (TPR) repeat protein/DNA-binding XRE family transcriptional regulator
VNGREHHALQGGHPFAVPGERLRRLRAAAGLTQAELAAQADVSVRTIGQLERGGIARPRAASVHRLAMALGVADEELLSAGPAPPSPGAGARPRGSAADADDPGQGRVPLWVGILGPLEIRRGGRVVDIASPTLRAMLAMLAMRPGRIIGVSEFVDALWPEDPPQSSRELVHTYISSLRRSLEPGVSARAPGRRLRREPAGYRLLLGPAESDSGQFADLARRARQARAGGAHQSAWQLYTEALNCWRGPFPVAVEDRLARYAESGALLRDRVSAALAWADLGLSFAYYARVAAALRALAAEEPLHEGIAARLMIALAGEGQQAAALGLFDSVRERLDSSLGMSPGPELREAHLRVLRGRLPIAVLPQELKGTEAAPVPSARNAGHRSASALVPAVPAQLPADVSAFTGREAELRTLSTLLANAATTASVPGNAAPPLVAVITGMAGVGKTALALHWAHRTRRRFPDGQFFADLHGHGDGPARPIDVLAGFLLTLGVPHESVPADEDQAAALLRSCLDGKRVLIVLDNAASARQVRPLLSASPGSATVITARERLAGLAARHGAALLILEPLPRSASAGLLAQVIGRRRADADPAAVTALSDLCAHLPLALRIAAANLTTRPAYRLADYVTKLAAGDRLTALAVEGDPQTAVRAAFESSCDALEPADRCLFVLAGTAPGRDLPAESAAALAGVSPSEAERALGRLAARNLVVEHAPGRYAFHDLLRLYAGDLAETQQSAAALQRLARYQCRRLEQVANLAFPHLLQMPRLEGEPEPDPATGTQAGFGDAATAAAWLDIELANLVALVGRLADDGWHHLALRISDRLSSYFLTRVDVVDFEIVIEAAERAATAVADPAAVAAVALWRGTMHGARWHFADAAEALTEATALTRQAGWTAGQAVAVNNLAHAHWMCGRVEDSIAGWRAALDLNRSSGRTVGESVTLANLGAAHLQLARFGPARGGDPVGEAIRLLKEALALHKMIRDHHNEAATVRLLAEAHRDRGDLRHALGLAREAVRLATGTGAARYEIESRTTLATVLIRLGDTEPGMRELRHAVHQAGDLGNLLTEAAVMLELANAHLLLAQPDDATLAVRDLESLVALIGVPMLERQIQWIRRRIADHLPTAATVPARHRQDR